MSQALWWQEAVQLPLGDHGELVPRPSGYQTHDIPVHRTPNVLQRTSDLPQVTCDSKYSINAGETVVIYFRNTDQEKKKYNLKKMRFPSFFSPGT